MIVDVYLHIRKHYLFFYKINLFYTKSTEKMKSVLITGANRGLGLGMVKYLIRLNRAEKIIATYRNVSQVRT